MRRLLRVVLSTLLLFCLAATPALATSHHSESRLLGDLWTYLLETPTSTNPFTGGDPCVRGSAGVVNVLFAPLGTTTLTCEVRSGTDIYVTPVTFECSTVESPPFYGGTPAELRACARRNLDTYSDFSLTLDGKPVRPSRVETRLLHIDLPAHNVLGTTEPTTRSVGAGQVALLRHLRPGVHTLHLEADGPPDATVDNTTTIIVRRKR